MRKIQIVELIIHLKLEGFVSEALGKNEIIFMTT